MEILIWLIGLVSTFQASTQLASCTNSANTLSLAKTWISECDTGHQNCKVANDGLWYPTRLIDCGTSMDLDGCRLIETKITTPSGRYVSDFQGISQLR